MVQKPDPKGTCVSYILCRYCGRIGKRMWRIDVELDPREGPSGMKGADPDPGKQKSLPWWHRVPLAPCPNRVAWLQHCRPPVKSLLGVAWDHTVSRPHQLYFNLQGHRGDCSTVCRCEQSRETQAKGVPFCLPSLVAEDTKCTNNCAHKRRALGAC